MHSREVLFFTHQRPPSEGVCLSLPSSLESLSQEATGLEYDSPYWSAVAEMRRSTPWDATFTNAVGRRGWEGRMECVRINNSSLHIPQSALLISDDYVLLVECSPGTTDLSRRQLYPAPANLSVAVAGKTVGGNILVCNTATVSLQPQRRCTQIVQVRKPLRGRSSLSSMLVHSAGTLPFPSCAPCLV